MIAGDKIAAGVTNDWYSQVMNFFHDICTESIAVGEFRLGIVDAFVNRATQMFEKRAKEMAIDRRNLPGRIDYDACRAWCALSQTESAQCGTSDYGKTCLARLLQKSPS